MKMALRVVRSALLMLAGMQLPAASEGHWKACAVALGLMAVGAACDAALDVIAEAKQ